MNQKIFITSTLPYANSHNPHIGHAFEFILSDAISRYFKNKYGNENVIFNTGLDQNGTKIFRKAKELNLDVTQYLSEVTESWLKFCQLFDIKFDNFYETSSPKHHQSVKTIWKKFVDNGDLYEKEYTGLYCFGCESFKQDKELRNGVCPDHQNLTIETITESNYFFNLSKYRDTILKWIESNPITPSFKNNELINTIQEFDEISVSRKKSDTTWGVDVPDRDDQVIYVWADALSNYFLAHDGFWDISDRTIQIFGPDNLRFQSYIYQAFLLALNKKQTTQSLVHGTIVDKDGRKMSKTVGNVINPIDQLSKYGLNAVRYYTLAGINTTSNASWNEDDLVNLYNSHLCDEWGNLVSRSIHLCNIKDIQIDENLCNSDIKSLIGKKIESVDNLWESLNIKEALIETNSIVKWVNRYINDTKPWIDGNAEVLNTIYWIITEVNKLYYPILPETSKDISLCLENREKRIYFERIKK